MIKEMQSKDKRCPFKFTVYRLDQWQEKHANCWLIKQLPPNRSGERLTCMCHGHHHPMEPHQLHACISCLRKSQMELARDCSHLDLLPSAAANLISHQDPNGLNWKASQVRHMTRMATRLISEAAGKKPSPTSLIIDSFNQRTDVSFVWVTFHPKHGLMLLNSTERSLGNRITPTSEQKAQLETLYAVNQRGNDDPEQPLLVILLFASDCEIRITRMNPEFLACNTTFGTTTTDWKELFTVAVKKDGNNRAFQGAKGYIPNAQTWIFGLVFGRLLVALWGTKVASHVGLMATDECSQEYKAVVKNIGPVSISLEPEDIAIMAEPNYSGV
jgi:hypothetical protein